MAHLLLKGAAQCAWPWDKHKTFEQSRIVAAKESNAPGAREGIVKHLPQGSKVQVSGKPLSSAYHAGRDSTEPSTPQAKKNAGAGRHSQI